MKRNCAIAVLVLIWSCRALAAGGGAGGGSTAAGLIRFDPPQPLGCVAARVDVPPDKMVTGLKWYNGTASVAFPRILVASGSGFLPPPYGEAVVVADSVYGQEQAWSTAVFDTPLASESGTLFVIMEYPPNYAPAPEGPVLGVAYAAAEAQYAHYVTGDGETWVRMTSNQCRVLVEPMLADRLPEVVALSSPGGSPVPGVPERLGLFVAPNPFNPETHIELYLPATTSGTVRVMDLRGRLVSELHRGPLTQGRNAFTWRGRDQAGRGVASGVYWVLAETDDDRLIKKVLLLK